MHMQRRMFHRFDGYDELKPLLDGSDADILGAFGGQPALIRIPAASTVGTPRARLVSCLLHGNEPAGFRAVVEVLRRGERFPFDLWVLIGNVRAATEDGLFAHRYLDDQEDFNRVWDGAVPGAGASDTRRCAAAVLDELLTADLEAAIDVHNNTGRNPYYAVLPQATPAARELAALCADTVLVWRMQAHTLMEALAPRCPAVAVECGAPDDPQGQAFASGVVHRFLTADGFAGVDSAIADPAAADTVGVAARPHRLIETVHRVTVRSEVEFSFGWAGSQAVDGGSVHFVIEEGHDVHNFGELPAGHTIGHVTGDMSMPLHAIDTATGRDVTAELFDITQDGRVVVMTDISPIMLTTTVVQTRRDCLFYTTRSSF